MNTTTSPDINDFVELLDVQASRFAEKPAFCFLGDGENVTDSLTYADLAQRARATAAALQRRAPAGARVLLLYPSCVEYMVAFFGCLCAGMVAVPVFPPRGSKHNGRLEAIAGDCGARIALTTTGQLQQMRLAVESSPALSAMELLCSDRIDDIDAACWLRPKIRPATIAFLQYTSGSTGAPKGVMISHGNLLHNERMIHIGLGSRAESVYVTWLPIYHDMGLIGNMLHAFWLGGTCYFMAPVSFLQRPACWLKAISRYRATISGGPNFAYQFCLDKLGGESHEGLDLSSWSVAFNGAEPVRHATLRGFSTAFADAGFQHRAWLPCYGMAESTLIATGGGAFQYPVVLNVDPAGLRQRQVVPVAAGHGVALVACGKNLPGQTLRIVDADSRELCAPDRIGEIWLAGPHIGHGYWGQREVSAATFQARVAGHGDGPFLRTGDLGFVHEGELYVAGRVKDVMILRGTNHYPQDIEACVESADDALLPTGAAAFAIEDGSGERAVVVAEVARTHVRKVDPPRLSALIRQRVLEQCELVVSDVVLIRPGTLPKTSSGKVQRSQTRQLYQAGELVRVGSPGLAEE